MGSKRLVAGCYERFLFGLDFDKNEGAKVWKPRQTRIITDWTISLLLVFAFAFSLFNVELFFIVAIQAEVKRSFTYAAHQVGQPQMIKGSLYNILGPLCHLFRTCVHVAAHLQV